ncbi:MAG TPA: Ig-like domain repeat protein [Pyrinomonadaceae bacterium]
MKSLTFARLFSLLVLLSLTCVAARAQTTFGGNAQHTGIYTTPAQTLNTIKWQTDIDFNNDGTFVHYGSPVVSAANSVFVPVKTATNGFRIDVFDGATGNFKYTVSTDYILPASIWIIPYNLCIVGTRLYFAGAGGTMFHIDNIDSNTPTAPVREVFYTTLATYNGNAANFNNTVFVNTPITADAGGNIFFGFRVQGTAPGPLNTTQGGLARISSNGLSNTYVLAGTAAGDSAVDRDSHAAGPALSNDGSSVYFPVKSSTDNFHAYLLELNSTTLATKHTVFLRDPRNNAGAQLNDISTSSPMVAPDGDVYFGVFGNSGNGSRGFLLRFSGDLQTTKTPGAFGWDYTPGVVPASMVPSYTGSSSYLLFCKYNNYTSSDADGVNRVAILDPNSTQLDPHSSTLNMVEMREVLTLIGPTPDDAGPGFPFAVQEFCINAPAVNPATNSVFFDSEDGHLYRWNLVANTIDQAVALSPGIGQPYVPTVIGPDGTLYTLNGGNFFAVGTKAGVSVTISSSMPDVRTVVVGQSLTFTATVGNSLQAIAGTVTFTDLSYDGQTPVTTTLATNVPLNGAGQASVTTSALTASTTNFGNHFITATYSGDGSHPNASVTMLQKVHAFLPSLGLTSSNPTANPGDPVTITATLSSVAGIPTGQVTFFDGQTVIGQVYVGGDGRATITATTLSIGKHAIRAEYASDTRFASPDVAQINQVVGPFVAFTNPFGSVSEGAGHIDIQLTAGGSRTEPLTVNYETSDAAGSSPCSATTGHASSRCDYLPVRGSVTFAPSDTSKTISIPIVDDSFVEGLEDFSVTLTSAVGGSIADPAIMGINITDNDSVNGPNPIDQAEFFVRQQYLDFLNREPDTDGFNFWTNEITSCGANTQCIEAKRINVSAAFFLSIEFQETGYLVYRTYKTGLGNLPGAPVPIGFTDFLRDTQTMQQGFQVNVGNWQAQLEANKQAFVLAFVQRSDFLAAFPNSMTAQEFVNKLDQNAGGVLSPSENANLVAQLGGTPADINKRAQVLRAVAEDSDLRNAEFNKAFVLMQYFGYLRRSPNEAPEPGLNYDGYNFWLNKLNQFNGNYNAAEMVKSFLVSGEYRQRFGP